MGALDIKRGGYGIYSGRNDNYLIVLCHVSDISVERIALGEREISYLGASFHAKEKILIGMGEEIFVCADLKSCIDIVHIVSVKVGVIDIYNGMGYCAVVLGEGVSVADEIVVVLKLYCAAELIIDEIDICGIFSVKADCAIENYRAVISIGNAY